MTDSIPELSQAIEIFPFNADEYIVCHKTLGYNININRNTYLILGLIDGKRSITDIQSKFKSDYDILLSTNFIADLLYKQLANFGIVLQNDFVVKRKEKADYLKLSFIFIPSSVLRFITPLFAFLFKRWVFYPLLIGFFILISLVIALNYPVIKYWLDIKSFSLIDLSLYLIIFQIGNLFHEIGHASALRYFNAESGGIGFGFYLFTPALFTDVSEAWKLDKKERIIVNLGGIYFELLIAGLLLLFYFFKGDILFLILPCVLILSTLINLNPFLKLDGYWMLSDATNTPNLRKRSIAVLHKKLTQIKKIKLQFNSIGEGLLFLYSLVSILFIFVFIITVLVNDPYSIVKFPLYLVDMFLQFKSVNLFTVVKTLFVPVIFWYLLFSLITQYFKFIKNRNDHAVR